MCLSIFKLLINNEHNLNLLKNGEINITLAIIRQTLCVDGQDRDSSSLSVNFVQISIDGKKLEKVTKIPLISPSTDKLSKKPYIFDQRKSRSPRSC